MRVDLHTQANAIEAILTRHEIPARIAGGTVQPNVIRFRLSGLPPAAVFAVEAISGEIARALEAPGCDVYVEAGRVIIAVPRNGDRPTLRLLDLVDRMREAGHDIPPMTAVLGLDRAGVPLLVRLSSMQHILVAGQPGIGKSSLLRAMAASLAMHNTPETLQILLPGQVSARALSATLDEMKARHQGKRASPRLILFVDDLDRQPALELPLRQLLAQGGPVGIHVVASITDAAPAWLAGLVPLFPVAIQGQAPPGAHIARTDNGQESRLYGASDFLIITRRGDVARLAAACIETQQMARLWQGRAPWD